MIKFIWNVFLIRVDSLFFATYNEIKKQSEGTYEKILANYFRD